MAYGDFNSGESMGGKYNLDTLGLKSLKGWAPIENYNPDRQRSHSALFMDETPDGMRWILAVKGLGAITLGAQFDEAGVLQFQGVAIFTDAEIHTGRLS